MKKTSILFIILFVFIFNVARSQVANYAFTTGTGTYTSITGISPVLTGDGTNATRDEGYANNIPLGFTFNYLGTDYTTISASANGFAAFGTITTPGFSNNLATGGTGRPLLAPLWEDIALAAATDLQYATTGAAGSRIFTLQWANVYFDFGAGNTSLSFQLRLYETTNVIEFIYNQLPGIVQDYSGGASIGITGASTGSGNFLSLNNSTALATVSSTVAVNNIKTRPATGQLYTFTPPVCTAPNVSITNVTTTGAMFTWSAVGGGTDYEYAISTSAIPPASGTSRSAGSLTLAGLSSGTQYYFHLRTSCGGSFSGWNSAGFTTACDAATIPYTMPISNVVCPALPACTTVSDVNHDGNTWRSYPSGGQGWTDQVLAYVYNINGTTPANDWLFTGGLNLVAGTYYRLKFKYNNDYTSLYAEKLKVAFGDANTAAAMTNILADYPSVFSSTPKTVSIDFTPPSSGIYYIGFQAYSDANKDVLILDDISVDARPSCDVPDTLLANVVSAGTSATVSWTPPSFGTPAGYEYAVITSATPPASGTATASLVATTNSLIPYTQYYLHVRSNCGASFSAWATIPFSTAGNDDACKAITLTSGGAAECGNNTLATLAASDPESNCSSADHTLWYKYTATASGTVVLHITTPGAPANPLHGWVGWYLRSSNCPNIALYQVGSCNEFGNNGNNDVRDILSPVLTNGVTYYIMIDGYSDDTGEFCISIPACSPAVAVHVDNILSASASVSWSGTGTFVLEYGPTGFTPGTGATAGAGGTVITPAVSPKTITGLNYSTTYDVYIRHNCTTAGSGYSTNSTVATFTTKGPPPSNDDCSGATVLTVFDGVCGGATAGTTLNATASSTTPFPTCGDEPGGYDDDVWYSFTPVAGQLYANINFAYVSGYPDVTAAVYTSSNNTCSGTFTLFSCHDDGGPASMPGFTSLPVAPGTTYFIRVFSDTIGVSSQFTICVTKALPPNDNAGGAITINVDAGCTGAIYNNDGSTQSADEPVASCSSTKGYATVWYKFTAPAGGAVKISTAAGSGNTLTNSRIALFEVTNANDYSTFNIIGCDEDGGSGSFGSMSVLYAAGLTDYHTYYIQVDKFDSAATTGSFCLTIEKLRDTMLSVTGNCNSIYQTTVGSIASYNGWVSLMDENSKLIALVRNPAGGPVNAYTAVQNINTGAVRKDITSGEYYLNRSYTINNTANANAALNVQFFFLANELAALKAVDPSASLYRLRMTSQSATACQPDFITANGANTELSQTANGISNGVNWITVNTNGYANYYIHTVKSYLTAKVFLQGAYSSALGRHKDVTPAWASVLNTFAKNQPYNTTAYADTVRQGFGAGAQGGAGQQVVHVTNLNATGPGSLFAAMGSNRTIVFDVAGTINNFAWGGSGSNSVSYLTIDGSTAPSPGITINNNNNGDCLSFDGSSCHDIIVKYIRVRNAGNDGINCINGSHDIVIDHCSIAGSRDGNLDMTTGSYNITVQYCILGSGNTNWSGNMLIGYSPVRNISVHHTLFSPATEGGVGERNPMINWIDGAIPSDTTLVCDFRNNVVWKWGRDGGTNSGYGTAVCYNATANIVNNYYYSIFSPGNAVNTSDAYGNGATGKAYISGNVSGNSGINPNSISNMASPFAAPAVTTQDVSTATATVLAKSGVRPLDETDLALINAVSAANTQGFTNQPPIANSGNNITLALPANSATLNGSGIDADGTIVSYAWTKVGGPSTYTLTNANSATATISNLVPTTNSGYTFRLTVTDNDGATSFDDVRVIVVNTGANQIPVANAGIDQVIILPTNFTTLTGTATDADGTINSYTWSRVSGPTTFSLGTADAASTTLTNLQPGTYVFKLTVTDNNAASGTDNITVIVNPATANNIAPYGSYAGAETVPGTLFTSTPAVTDITDWVMLEIRNASGSIVCRRAALVREDGHIVDTDGLSPVSLDGLVSGNYYVTVRHRNHLSISTQNLLSFTAPALGVAPVASSAFDFTTAADAEIFGDTAAFKIINGTSVMTGTNANGNNNIRFTGVNNDVGAMLSALNGLQGTVLNSVYHLADTNMDGGVKFTGINNDTGFLLSVLGGNQAKIITEQKR